MPKQPCLHTFTPHKTLKTAINFTIKVNFVKYNTSLYKFYFGNKVILLAEIHRIENPFS